MVVLKLDGKVVPSRVRLELGSGLNSLFDVVDVFPLLIEGLLLDQIFNDILHRSHVKAPLGQTVLLDRVEWPLGKVRQVKAWHLVMTERCVSLPQRAERSLLESRLARVDLVIRLIEANGPREGRVQAATLADHILPLISRRAHGQRRYAIATGHGPLPCQTRSGNVVGWEVAAAELRLVECLLVLQKTAPLLDLNVQV